MSCSPLCWLLALVMLTASHILEGWSFNIEDNGLAGAAYSTVTVEIPNEWPGGFQGKISAYITEDIIGGWTMTLVFPIPVASVEIWQSQVIDISSDKTTYVFENMPYNADLLSGTALMMTFNGVTIDDMVPESAVAYFSAGHVPEVTTITTASGTTKEVPITTSSTTTLPATSSPGHLIDKYNYIEVLHMSILFFEAQRSGPLPENNRVPWRGDSGLHDQGHKGEDLTGGWYDAGDRVKFNLPGAFATTMLTWGLLESWDAYERAGELDNMLDCIKWELDYFIKCHTGPNEVYGQVGNGNMDHTYCCRAEEMPSDRPAYKLTPSKPGSDLAAEMAAAMAAGSIAFKGRDSDYSNTLLHHAREVYDFAYKHRGLYSDSIPDAGDFYKSGSYEDELGWGALWLHLATGDWSYLNKAVEFRPDWYTGLFSWGDKRAGFLVLHCAITRDAKSCNGLQTFVNYWLHDVTYTPGGLAFGGPDWGSNMYAVNAAFIALMAAKMNILATDGRDFARSQIHYMLGDSGRSFVVGFSHNSPESAHHAGAACPDLPAPCTWKDFHRDSPNPQVIYGGLVGGPDAHDNYVDDRQDYVHNEVALGYNAGFQSTVAALFALNFHGTEKQPGLNITTMLRVS